VLAFEGCDERGGGGVIDVYGLVCGGGGEEGEGGVEREMPTAV